MMNSPFDTFAGKTFSNKSERFFEPQSCFDPKRCNFSYFS